MNDDTASKIAASLLPRLEEEVGYHLHFLTRSCESPIEIMLATSLLLFDHIANPFPRLVYGRPEEWPDPEVRLLIPQYAWGGWRIDFAIRLPHISMVFIECDGHDFHERTKEQAARDRRKDREIQTAGFPILRFTGSEIYRDPGGCAEQVWSFVDGLYVPKELRA